VCVCVGGAVCAVPPVPPEVIRARTGSSDRVVYRRPGFSD